MIHKTLDAKLERMRKHPDANEFILADAKDADMAFGISAPGIDQANQGHGDRFRSIQEYRDLIRENIKQGLVDIMLMSASTNDVLMFRERLFDESSVTPAIRANDTTDIWLPRGGAYYDQPSRAFRTAYLDTSRDGDFHLVDDLPPTSTELGLYSLTFNNDAVLDQHILDAYSGFREDAASTGFRHFLEFFDPNAPVKPVADVGAFMNDMIVRTLAGVAGAARPIFLKVVYHGPAAMEELASYDSDVIVGIMGGSSGTTFDAFRQLWEARKHGARAALYGRMINNAQDQASFIRHLRALADGLVEPEEAVRSYHADLARGAIRPVRSLEDDLRATVLEGS
jgi:hypothetical protein